MRSVEIFTGAGGLALGVSHAGFEHLALVEWNHTACETMRANKARGAGHPGGWPIHQSDVSTFDFGFLGDDIDLLAGGPPCQPFSLGGKHRGHEDSRNMFPALVRAVRALKPKAILVENVRGLVRPSFANYFQYILRQLAYPEITRGEGERWSDHQERLERHHTSSPKSGLMYNIVPRVLNAADYGVPQKRERVFIVGFRSDLDMHWSFPAPTHSCEALLWDQWVDETYWDRHGIPISKRPEPAAQMCRHIQRFDGRLTPPTLRPWRTVRDALAGLPDPEGALVDYGQNPNHEFVGGARSYPGHTGSPVDEPAKTLKAGDHGVPGGENMLTYSDGRVRYFTVRECARLQDFPDTYVFIGSRTEMMRQLGNAVPVTMGTLLADGIRARLEEAAGSGYCNEN